MKKSLKLKNILIIIIVVILIIYISLIAYYNIRRSKDEEINNKFNNIGENTEEAEQISDKYVYSIINKNFNLFEIEKDREEEYQGIKLYEYNNVETDYAEIFFISYDYMTDGASTYNLSITDEKGKSLLKNEELNKYEEKQIVGGIISTVKIEKINLNEEIIFKVIERDYKTQKILRTASVKIDLSKDLEKQIIIDQSNMEVPDVIGDIKFKRIEDKFYYHGTTEHAYSKKLIGENMSWGIKSQYGNYLVQEEHIEFWKNANVNKLSLKEAFEDFVLISNNLGQYGLSDVYGVNIMDENGEFLEEMEIFNFEEMLNIAKGEIVIKNGKKYSKSDFGLANMNFKKDCDTVIGHGINAIKYELENNEEDYYMFIYKDNIYYIRFMKSERTEAVVKMFLNSLELN